MKTILLSKKLCLILFLVLQSTSIFSQDLLYPVDSYFQVDGEYYDAIRKNLDDVREFPNFGVFSFTILPLKWQNTADIVVIHVGLKQETVSLLPRKCARGICGTMIA